MNRLTKKISLVLVSSSLVLHGCEEPHRFDNPREVRPGNLQAEKDDQKDENTATTAAGGGSTSSTRSGSSTTYSSHGGTHIMPVPIPFRSSRSSGISSSSSISHSSGTSSGKSSSVSSSSRGGFGSSAHGVSS